MRRATEADVLRLAGQLEAAAKLLRAAPNCECVMIRTNADGEPEESPACRSRLDHALRVARQASGFVRARGEGSHGGDTPNPVLAALLTRLGELKGHKGYEWWEERMSRDATLVSGALADLIIVLDDLGTVRKTDPKGPTKNGQGVCPACDVFCTGQEGSRLKAGLCDTDYKAWTRDGRPARFEFIQRRRAERGVAV